MAKYKHAYISEKLKDRVWDRDYGNTFIATCNNCEITDISIFSCEFVYIENGYRAICKYCNRKKISKEAQITIDEMLIHSLSELIIIPDKILCDPLAVVAPDPYLKIAKVFGEFNTYFHARIHTTKGEDLYIRYRLIVDDIIEGKKHEISKMQTLLYEFRNSEGWLNNDYDNCHYREKEKFAQLAIKWANAKQEYMYIMNS